VWFKEGIPPRHFSTKKICFGKQIATKQGTGQTSQTTDEGGGKGGKGIIIVSLRNCVAGRSTVKRLPSRSESYPMSKGEHPRDLSRQIKGGGGEDTPKELSGFH